MDIWHLVPSGFSSSSVETVRKIVKEKVATLHNINGDCPSNLILKNNGLVMALAGIVVTLGAMQCGVSPRKKNNTKRYPISLFLSF